MLVWKSWEIGLTFHQWKSYKRCFIGLVAQTAINYNKPLMRIRKRCFQMLNNPLKICKTIRMWFSLFRSVWRGKFSCLNGTQQVVKMLNVNYFLKLQEKYEVFCRTMYLFIELFAISSRFIESRKQLLLLSLPRLPSLTNFSPAIVITNSKSQTSSEQKTFSWCMKQFQL